MAIPLDYQDFPKPPAGQFERWNKHAHGDGRDDVRAALSAGDDSTDNLQLAAIALAAMDESSGRPSDPESQQAAIRATIRLLNDSADILRSTFAYLWDCALACM